MSEGKILIVDDQPMNIKLLAALLEADHELLFATDGARALELAATAKPDLILLDVTMPGMDGFDVCRELKRRAVSAEIPVIFVTARTDMAAELNGLNVGAVDYITKPISPPVVRMRVRTHMQLKRARDNLSLLASTDALTGIGNRRLGLQQIESMLAHSRRSGESVAVLLIDLDRFKQVNDQYGHQIGDEVLTAVSRSIAEAVRDTDVLARLGGDEFVIGLSSLDAPEKAAVVAQRVIDALSAPLLPHVDDLKLTPSIGISLSPSDGLDIAELLKFADQAMYAAKEEGRGCFRFFSREMHERAASKNLMEERLRHAVAQSDFELHFQEQVDLSTGKLVAVEALLRAGDPALGLPSYFVPLAEELNLMKRLGAFALAGSMEQMRRWRAAGSLLERVAVNVSAKQFQDPSLADSISEMLQESGIPPTLLEIEVTETAAMDNADDTIRSLKKLKNLGIAIAIDDFGTGYSSLSYLRRFPIDRIKIDRAFVCNLETDNNDVEIVKAIISLAKTMGLSVLAEGVETPGQLQLLKKLGCDFAQGFLLGRPKPAHLIAQAKPLATKSDTEPKRGRGRTGPDANWRVGVS